MPLSARIAWSYVACLFSGLVAGLLIVVTNASLAAVLCRAATGDDFSDCKFAWVIWVGIVGFVLCLLPAVLLLKLDAWLWAAAAAAMAFLVASGAIDQWWWWTLAAVVPAAAAVLSANWERGRALRRAQLVLLVLLDVAAAATLFWWYQQA
jgi:hypothetical protein